MPSPTLKHLLTGLLAFSLAACGGGGGSSSATSTSGTAPAAPSVALAVTSPTTPIVGSPVTLAASATGSNLSYTWSYGDGSGADATGGAHPQHTYVNSGSYHVSVTVKDTATNATASASATVIVYAPILTTSIDTVTPASAQANALTNFTSTPPSYFYPPYYLAPGATSDWDFGDGGAHDHRQAPSHIYTTPGTYTVTLTVTDGGLNVGFASTTVVIGAASTSTTNTATISHTDTYITNPISFTAAGTGQGLLGYAWSFGDGSTATGQTVSHRYASTGNYPVTLTVSDSLGGHASATETIAVTTPPPPATPPTTPPAARSITPSPLKPMTGQAVTLSGGASGGSYYALTYSWNFGDGNSSAASASNSITHIYSTAGSYQVTLTVTDTSSSLSASASATLVVTNRITTSVIAGVLSSAGSSDGTGNGAQFTGLSGTAVDAAGNIYVADTGNNLIRKVTPAGVVTTLAGTPISGSCSEQDGTGPDATFCSPRALTVDAVGNVYVADLSNTIRKITPAGVVVTLAGQANASGSTNGAGNIARFNQPSGIVADTQGNLFVADTGNGSIRKITATGVVSTYAGLATNYCYGNSLELDGSSTTASFCAPTGITIDGSGVLYVTDANAGTIRRVGTSGYVSTLAGYVGNSGCIVVDGTGSSADFCSPTAIAYSGSKLYVADTGSNSVRMVTLAGAVTTIAGVGSGYVDATGPLAKFRAPSGIAIDSSGNIYIGDTGNNTLRTRSTTGTVGSLAGTPVIHPTSTDGTGSGARFVNPTSIATDSSGNIYVADSGTQTLRKITMPGAVVTTLAGHAPVAGGSCTPLNGTGSAATFCGLMGLAVDSSSGNVYAIDGNAIRKITQAGVVTTLAGSQTTSYCPYNGAVNGTGTAATFCSPRSLTIDASGNLYVADTGNNLIRKVTPTGIVSTFAGNGVTSAYPCVENNGTGTAASFCTPSGIVIGSFGNLYVTDSGASTVRKITAAGVVTTLAGTAGITGSTDSIGAFASFNGPGAMTIDSTGKLYIVDGYSYSYSYSLRVVTPAGAVSTLTGVPLGPNYNTGYYSYTPYIAMLPDNRMVFGYMGLTVAATSPL
jgi:PKD repeat protein